MKPLETLARTRGPDGAELVLTRRDGVYRFLLDGQELMGSRAHGSERALAERACARLVGHPNPRLLIGGLGCGYTLRAALDASPPGAQVVVCEFFELVVDAHRQWLGELTGHPLDDPRVRLERTDLRRLLPSREPFDAILLDIDNGPWAFTLPTNGELYSPQGLTRLLASLAPGGVLAVWSAEPCPEFTARLTRAGFSATCERAESHGRKHWLFFGQRSPRAGAP
jgi:spermidine synthase